LRRGKKQPLPFKRFRYGYSIYIVKDWQDSTHLLVKKQMVCSKIPFDIENRFFGIKFPIKDNLGFTVFKILQ